MRYYGVNRYLCTVLDAMRKCDETKNYSYLIGLIEEAQYLGTAMEDALSDVNDVKRLKEDRSKLKKECKELEKKVKELKAQLSKKKGKPKNKHKGSKF